MAFTKPGLGYKGKVGFAKESSYGVNPAAQDAVMEILSARITPRLSTVDDGSLSATQVSRRFIGQGGQSYELSFRFRVGYEGLLHLLRAFFPTYSNTVVETGVRDHVFKEGAELNSYSFDLYWGDVPTGRVNRFSGAYGTELRISGQAGQGEGAMLVGEATFVASIMTPNVTPMTPATLPTPLGVIYHQALRTLTNLRDGSTLLSDAIQLTGFEFSVRHPHDTNRFLFGQVSAAQPVRNGFTEGTYAFDEEWNDSALVTAALGGAPTAVGLVFQHPTTIGAASKREFAISGSSPQPGEYGSELPGFGVITQKVTYKLAYNSSDASFAVIRVRSTEAALT